MTEDIGAQIVDAMALIGVVMSPDHRVDALDLGGKKLGAQIGLRVDQDGFSPILHQDRAPSAPVARVVGIGRTPVSKPAVAAAARHTSRSPTAQDRH
jgi:hypothetical protein